MKTTIQKKAQVELKIIDAYLHCTKIKGELVKRDKYITVLFSYVKFRLAKYTRSDATYRLDDDDVFEIQEDCFLYLDAKYDKSRKLENYLNRTISLMAKSCQVKKVAAHKGLTVNRIAKDLNPFKKKFKDLESKHPNDSLKTKLELYAVENNIKYSTAEGYYKDCFKNEAVVSIEELEKGDSYETLSLSVTDNYEFMENKYARFIEKSSLLMDLSEFYWKDHFKKEYFSVLETCFILRRLVDAEVINFFQSFLKLQKYEFIHSNSFKLFCKREKLPKQKDIGLEFKKTTVSVDTKNYKNYLIKGLKEVNNV